MFWVDMRTDFAGECKSFCIAHGIHFYYRMSETKIDFAERAKRSIKKIFYRHMEDDGYK